MALPAVVLVLCLAGLYLTRGSMANLSFLNDPNSGLVNQRPWQTIQALAPLAVSAEEERFAQEAERLADHEVDQAFAFALREASTRSKVLSPEALALSQKASQLQDAVKADKAQVVALGGDAKAPVDSAAGSNTGNDDLDAARTQLQIDTDELDDANEEFAKATGDKRGEIQQELAEREAAIKKTAVGSGGVDGGGKTAVVSAKSHGTLAKRIGAWFDQRTRHGLLLQAQREAKTDIATLQSKHAEVEQRANEAAAAAKAGMKAPAASLAAVSAATSAPATALGQVNGVSGTARGPADNVNSGRAARLQLLHTLSEEHSILDDRLATEQQLSQVYEKWAAQVERQHGIVLPPDT